MVITAEWKAERVVVLHVQAAEGDDAEALTRLRLLFLSGGTVRFHPAGQEPTTMHIAAGEQADWLQ
jgi:hypothetical protein